MLKFKRYTHSKRTVSLFAVLLLTMTIGLWLILGCSAYNFNSNPDMELIRGQASTMLAPPTDGSKPSDHTPNDNAFYAFKVLSEQESFSGYSDGKAVTNVAFASVNQNIKAHRIIDGDTIYKESLSHSSFKGVGVISYISGENFVIHDASSISSINNVAWKETASTVSEDSYIDKFGHYSNSITAYVFTEETILSSEYLGEKDGVYSFKYVLDTEKATGKMALEMRTMAGTSSLPIFDYVSMTFHMDENWRILETQTDCTYKVDMLGGVTCNESLREVFEYEQPSTIPNVEFYENCIKEGIKDPVEEQSGPLDYLMSGFTDYIIGTKPLKAELKVDTVVDSVPLIVNGAIAIKLNIANLSNVEANVFIDSIKYGEYEFEDIFVAFKENAVFFEYNGFKATGTIDEFKAMVEKIMPVLKHYGVEMPDVSSSMGSIDTSSLLSGATVSKEGDVATVSLPLELGGIKLTANLNFNDTKKITFIGANVNVAGVDVALTANDSLDVPSINGIYTNVTTLLNIIDEDYNVSFKVDINEHSAFVKFNILTLTADVSFGDILVKYENDVVYVNYKDIKAKFDINDIDSVIAKIQPILTNYGVDMPDFNSMLTDINTKDIISSVINNLALSCENNLITVSTSYDKVNASIVFSTENNELALNKVVASVNEYTLTLAPATETFNVIDNNDLVNYADITTLLNIIDEDYNVSFKVDINEYSAFVKLNILTLTADVSFGDILVKYVNDVVYVNYKDIKAKFDINDIDSVIAKIQPILTNYGVDMPDFNSMLTDINTKDIISSVINNLALSCENNLITVSTSYDKVKASIVFSTENNELVLSSVNVEMEDLSATLAPATETL